MWQRAVIILVPKSDKLDDPSQFRPIALSNCDGKIFFSLLSKHLLEYLISNNYMITSVQKGFLPKVAGCVEHTTLSLSAVRDAKKAGRSICTSWIDLRNAFGSIRHSFIQFALSRYHLPPHFRQVIFNYYENLIACVVTKSFVSAPFHYSIGVFQRCTISPTLFNITFQMLLNLLTQPQYLSLAYTLKDNPNVSTLVAAYADDLQLTTRSAAHNQLLLNQVDKFLTLSVTMCAKPSKCFVLALKKFDSRAKSHTFVPLLSKSYSHYNPHLFLSGEEIKAINDEGFRNLGVVIEPSLQEHKSRLKIVSNLKEWLEITNSALVGNIAKLWLLIFISSLTFCGGSPL